MKNIIVALGYSLIKGNPIPDTGGWVQRVFDKLGERENFILINKGGGGDNTLNLLERIDLDCLSHKPSGVILGVGVNDSRIRDSKNMANEVSIEQYKANLEKIISILRNESISLCLFAPLPVVDSLSDPFKPDKRYQLKWVQLYHNTFVEIVGNRGQEIGDRPGNRGQTTFFDSQSSERVINYIYTSTTSHHHTWRSPASDLARK